MRLRLVAGVLVFFVFASIALVSVLFGPSLLRSGSGNGAQPFSQTNAGNVIERENARSGTTNWQISPNKAASTEIQSYAGATSVLPGQRLAFYVSTQKDGTPYAVNIYRLGWYGGDGGREMVSQVGLVGHAQGYYNSVTRTLVDCSACKVDTRTGLVEADWQPSYVLAVPPDWVTGIYLAKFSDAFGKQTYVPFDVRGNPSSRYIVVTSDTTYAAYNDWGGYSLYKYDSHPAKIAGRAVKISFDRPYIQDYGSGYVLSFKVNAIRWLERQGYDLSYMSSVDLHEDPSEVLHHRAYLSLGHDEYWTKEMRDGVD